MVGVGGMGGGGDTVTWKADLWRRDCGCEVCAMTGTHGNGFTENDDSWPPSPLMTMTEWIANGWFIVWKMGTTCEPIYMEVSREMGQDRTGRQHDDDKGAKPPPLR